MERFEFAHDADLYSWIVKDIVINHHFRLIGQLTSAPGIFIGPYFYYLLVPFFILSHMDPVGANGAALLIGLATIFSFYFVLSKLFSREAGLIGAFLYATLLVTVGADRWVVPTITTYLWSIWYLYIIVLLSRGNFTKLFLLGILIGLIWDVHIALLPTLLAIPISIISSKKFPTPKQSLKALTGFLIVSIPLFGFELRHHFQQTFGLINNFFAPKVGSAGLYKLQLVFGMVVKNTGSLLFAPQSFGLSVNILFVIALLLSPVILVKKKILSSREILPLYGWIAGVVLFFSISSSPISEYYFANINVIFLTIISLFLSHLYKNKLFKSVILILFTVLLIKNSYFLISQSYYNKGYVEKKAVVKFISEDANARGFPCVGISYITTPGENVGFRYLFYLEGTHLVHPSLQVPVYNIVIPDELSKDEVKLKFGHIGIIPPERIPTKAEIDKSCQTPNTNLTDPVFGYVE